MTPILLGQPVAEAARLHSAAPFNLDLSALAVDVYLFKVTGLGVMATAQKIVATH